MGAFVSIAMYIINAMQGNFPELKYTKCKVRLSFFNVHTLMVIAMTTTKMVSLV